MKIVSGGQTGADRAALDAAIALGLDHGGWLPRGRKTEDGPLPLTYKLQELKSGHYRVRTEQNVIDSCGTLICSFGPLTGGSALTEALAVKHGRPCLHIDFELYELHQAAATTLEWLKANRIRTVNVAGPRLSGQPKIYTAVMKLLERINWDALD